jgi:hypothetical protein
MTFERKIVVGIDDVKAVTFECLACKARTTILADSMREVPRVCSSCNAPWYRDGLGIPTHVSTSVPAATAFIQSIVTMRVMLREKKDVFRILLEFDEPEAS